MEALFQAGDQYYGDVRVREVDKIEWSQPNDPTSFDPRPDPIARDYGEWDLDSPVTMAAEMVQYTNVAMGQAMEPNEVCETPEWTAYRASLPDLIPYPAEAQQRAAEIAHRLAGEMVQCTMVAMGQALASGTGALMMAPDGTAKAVNVLMEWTPEQCAQMQTLQEAKRQMVEQCRQLLEPVYDGGPGHLAALARERDAARAERDIARNERDAFNAALDVAMDEDRHLLNEQSLHRVDYDRLYAAYVALNAEAKSLRLELASARVAVEERDAGYAYLRRLFECVAPQCVPLPDLMGICTQVDNALAGARMEVTALRAELAALHDILGTRPAHADSKPAPTHDFTRDFTRDRRRIGR